MNKETDKKREKYFSEKPGGYIVAAATGFLTCTWTGLFLSPACLSLINNSRKKQSSYKGRWRDWFFIGVGSVFTLYLGVIPSVFGTLVNPHSSAVKNGLVNGIKECIARESKNQTTNFSDVQSFLNPKAYSNYVLTQSSDPELKNSCFGAKAIPDPNYWEFNWFLHNPIMTTDATWYEINYKNGVAIKTCGKRSKTLGCDKGNKREW